MKVADTLFVRLFLLLFVVLYASSFASRELLDNLGWFPPAAAPYNPFSIRALIFRTIAAAVTAWVAARWLSDPIKRMAAAADELGKNLSAPPLDETSGPVEVRQAAKVFNQMQMRLKQQMEERTLFLAAVSHDLRTPLTRLSLRAESMAQQGLKTDVQRDIGEMAGIIESTLDYLRADEHNETTCRLDIAALVHSLAEDINEQEERVVVTGYARPVSLQSTATRRCLNNLIENALRYGDKAMIEISETDDAVFISIRDNGSGIPEDKLEAVFAPFFRLDDSRNRHTGGMGMGLAIARDMAKKQGGDVTLKNAPGGGLLATVTLPKR